MNNIISLSGPAASGKSTIGKIIAEKLGWEFISVGDFSRKFAMKEHGMNINDFQKLCKQNPKIDDLIDTKFTNEINRSNKLIVDYRLAYLFVPDALHVYLDVSEDKAVNRLLQANRVDEFKGSNSDSIRKTMNNRNLNMRERFLEKYDSDFLEKDNYSLIINTDLYDNFIEIADIIINEFKKYQNAHS